MTCAFYFIVYDIVFHIERKINYFINLFIYSISEIALAFSEGKDDNKYVRGTGARFN